jgi:sec-independent protein translocase protein TatB
MVMPPKIELGSLGMADSLILMVIALVVFGPRRLPQIGRQIGKLMYEFRKASNDFKYQMEEELRNAEDADRRKKEEERLAALAVAAPALPAATVETAVPSATSVMESTYPDQTQSPSQKESEPAGTTVPGEANSLIRPPATGEPIPAEKPTRNGEPFEAPYPVGPGASVQASLDFSPTPDPAINAIADDLHGDEAEQAGAGPTPSPEQAAHHG